VVAKEEGEGAGARELRRLAEAAVLGVEAAAVGVEGGVQRAGVRQPVAGRRRGRK